jgi:hypothetical protein
MMVVAAESTDKSPAAATAGGRHRSTEGMHDPEEG